MSVCLSVFAVSSNDAQEMNHHRHHHFAILPDWTLIYVSELQKEFRALTMMMQRMMICSWGQSPSSCLVPSSSSSSPGSLFEPIWLRSHSSSISCPVRVWNPSQHSVNTFSLQLKLYTSCHPSFSGYLEAVPRLEQAVLFFMFWRHVDMWIRGEKPVPDMFKMSFFLPFLGDPFCSTHHPRHHHEKGVNATRHRIDTRRRHHHLIDIESRGLTFWHNFSWLMIIMHPVIFCMLWWSGHNPYQES